MQISTGTALLIDKNANIRTIYEPDTNIRIGTKFLKQMLAKFNNNVPYTLAAYNAGPGNVYDWLYKNRNLNIKQIPFSETRNYISSIISIYNTYKTNQVLSFVGLPASTNANSDFQGNPADPSDGQVQQQADNIQFSPRNDITFYKSP